MTVALPPRNKCTGCFAPSAVNISGLRENLDFEKLQKNSELGNKLRIDFFVGLNVVISISRRVRNHPNVHMCGGCGTRGM